MMMMDMMLFLKIHVHYLKKLSTKKGLPFLASLDQYCIHTSITAYRRAENK